MMNSTICSKVADSRAAIHSLSMAESPCVLAFTNLTKLSRFCNRNDSSWISFSAAASNVGSTGNDGLGFGPDNNTTLAGGYTLFSSCVGSSDNGIFSSAGAIRGSVSCCEAVSPDSVSEIGKSSDESRIDLHITIDSFNGIFSFTGGGGGRGGGVGEQLEAIEDGEQTPNDEQEGPHSRIYF